MNEYKVSIIVPTFNRIKSLEKSIKSAINQSYKNIEIIVVNDNDNQETTRKVKETVLSLNDHRVIYYENGRNLGASRSRNFGIKMSTGDYITFLDDDDVYSKDKIKNQLNFMVKNNLDMTFTELQLADYNGKIKEVRKRDFLTDFSYKGLIVANMMHHINGTSTYMFKRDTLLSVGLFPDVIIGEDYFLMVNTIESGAKISLAPFCDVTATLHNKSDGLSTGEYKLKGEKFINEFNKEYYNLLTNAQIRYVNMRYRLVVAYVLFRQKNIKFIAYAIGAFFTDVKGFFKEVSARI